MHALAEAMKRSSRDGFAINGRHKNRGRIYAV